MPPKSAAPSGAPENQTLATALLVHQGRIVVRDVNGTWALPMCEVPTRDHSPVVEMTRMLKHAFGIDLDTKVVADRMHVGYLAVCLPTGSPTRLWQHPMVLEITDAELAHISALPNCPWKLLKVDADLFGADASKFYLNHFDIVRDADFIFRALFPLETT